MAFYSLKMKSQHFSLPEKTLPLSHPTPVFIHHVELL